MTTPAASPRARIEAGLARHRAWEAAEARKALFVGASAWYVHPAGRRAAAFAVEAAARALALPLVPELAWFRPAGPHDGEGDPGAFRADPHLLGYVDPARPTVIGLNARLSQYPAAGCSPSLQEVVAHEAQHVKDLLDRRGVPDRQLQELRADVTAWRLLRGEAPPF